MFIYGYIWEGDAAYFLEQFALLDGSYPILEINIHCYGGSVFDGNMIYNAMVNATSQVNTNVIGVGASMGAVLTQAGKIRRQVSNGFQMIHAASGYTHGTYQDHLNNANLLKEMGKNFTSILMKNTGKTASEVGAWLVGDNWFSAEQALEAGLIDEIIDAQDILDIEIEDPQAIGSQEIYSRFAASMQIEDKRPYSALPKPRATTIAPKQKERIIKSTHIMEQSSIELLGLQGVSSASSETRLVQAIQAKYTDLENKYEKEKTAKENLETAINAQKDSKVTALLDEAVSSGKITAQQKEVYANIGKTSGVEALETVLGGLSQRTPLATMVQPGKTGTTTTVKAGWNWDKYQKEDPRALETMRTDNLDGFKALFKAKFGVDFSED